MIETTAGAVALPLVLPEGGVGAAVAGRPGLGEALDELRGQLARVQSGLPLAPLLAPALGPEAMDGPRGVVRALQGVG